MEIAYEPGVATFSKQRGDLADDLRDLRAAGFSRRHAAADARQSRREADRACASRPFFDMALDESPNESAGHLDAETEDGVLLFENRRNDFQRGVAFVATSLANAETETIAPALLRRAGTRHHDAGVRRERAQRRRPRATTDGASPLSRARSRWRRAPRRRSRSSSVRRRTAKRRCAAAREADVGKARSAARGDARTSGPSGSDPCRSRPTGRTSTGW